MSAFPPNSHCHPDLVPSLDRRLADRLGLPFSAIIDEARGHAPPKHKYIYCLADAGLAVYAKLVQQERSCCEAPYKEFLM
ncbi:hypothetical protein [Halochromatium glycolicum]|uniref:Uncharacterized protein n=1 Tax=Halochromatium glycolicum TaxID=85075 RepID=A0AAJ0U5U8_9GAMM|nr:hypothetical protein [Halochromatium glycolicum]MBK1705839.1 hypothetical protein [Halochromatium glycolicum]